MRICSDRCIDQPLIEGYLHLSGHLNCVQVEGLLDRHAGQPPVIEYVVEEFERLGYASWAHRIINTASGVPNEPSSCCVVG